MNLRAMMPAGMFPYTEHNETRPQAERTGPATLPVPMNDFFQTEPFACALKNMLDYAAHGGADVSECFQAAQTVREGDYDSWHRAWAGLAERVRRSGAHELAPAGQRPRAARCCAPRTITGSRAGSALRPSETRACAPPAGRATPVSRRPCACPFPACQSVALAGAPTSATGYLYRAESSDDESGRPRPTLIAVGGEGVTVLDLYFLCAVAATRHGWHCLAAAAPTGDDAAAHASEPVFSAPRRAALALPCVDPHRLAVLTLSSPPPDGDDNRGDDDLATLGRFHQRLTRWLHDQQSCHGRQKEPRWHARLKLPFA
jgi:hypothetical protein